jgi:hypothetical protein
MKSSFGRQTAWFVDGLIKYHRTIETYVNGLIGRLYLKGFARARAGGPDGTNSRFDTASAASALFVSRRRAIAP